ncbi:MAG TPA: 50S ribosomal protein L4, partial [Mycobacterium sp.]
AKVFLGTLTDRKQVLVVIGRSDETGAKSVRNLPGVHILTPDQLNTYDVLRADDVVFSVEALNAYIAANTKSAEEVSA